MRKQIGLAAALGLGAITATAALAEDRKISFSSGFPESAAPPMAYKAVAEWLAGKGFAAEVHSMSLLSFTETPAGIRDGIADAGYVLTPYFPAEFSETNMAADMALLVSSGTDAPALAMTGAMAEYVLLNCPDCVAEYAAQNQLYLSGGASTEYSLVCTKPITTVADLKGISVRSGASVFGRWVEHFGGTKVSIPGSEMYEALSQKVVDCTMVSMPDVRNFQLMDVASDMTVNAPGGVFAGTASMNINLDLWQGLSDQERATMLEAAALMTANVAVIYHRQGIEAEEVVKAAGVKVVRVSDEIAAATKTFVDADLKTIEDQFTKLYGVENAAAKIETIKGLIEKWKGLVAPIDPTNVEAYRNLLTTQIYSKVDLASYGR
ncbi:TRAP transporter substrate-binding protein DctP [Gemmobacter sp.]|uniref:TRAP transporter substrate-binding protein DctP n=1 Tax=Gemmobacter sp. TaxID=1898957 RepID=UPI002AFF0E48|nr:TRAP transporter substrate-binding protein DctP [Gemmobacter sp.]